jgi:hypothetical protein
MDFLYDYVMACQGAIMAQKKLKSKLIAEAIWFFPYYHTPRIKSIKYPQNVYQKVAGSPDRMPNSREGS